MALTKKPSGISAVYSATTGVVVTTCESLNILAQAGKALAGNAETQAQISRIESAQALLEALGTDTNNKSAVEKITEASALLEALRNM